MPARMTRRLPIALTALSIAAAGVIGCGQEKGDVKQPNATVPTVDAQYEPGAKLFVERWGATLARENYPNGQHVLRARDRARRGSSW